MQRGSRAGGRSLVEDQIQHPLHGDDSFRTLGRRGHLELGDAGLDPLFGSADALGHGRLRDQ
jgi:hypothetical protein